MFLVAPSALWIWISCSGYGVLVVKKSFLGGLEKNSLKERSLDSIFERDGYPSEEGTVLMPMKKAERKRDALMANLGDLNRPLRVRPVNVMGRDWWAVDAEDIWPGMVMDLRRLGFESMAWEDEVLVREGSPAYEPQMEGPAGPEGLKSFPVLHPTIQILKDQLADTGYLEEREEVEDEEAHDIELDEALLHE